MRAWLDPSARAACHELRLALHERLGAHDARVHDPAHDRQDEDQLAEPGAERRGHDDRQQDERKRELDVAEPADQIVHSPP